MGQELKRATVRATGKVIEVYKIQQRGTWCDFADCKTEYKPSEITIL